MLPSALPEAPHLFCLPGSAASAGYSPCRSSQDSWRWWKSLPLQLYRAAFAAFPVVVNLAGFTPFRCPTAFCTARSRGPKPSDSRWHRRRVLGVRTGGHQERDGHAAIFYRCVNVQKPCLVTGFINHQWLIGTKGTKRPSCQWEGCLRGNHSLCRDQKLSKAVLTGSADLAPYFGGNY